MALFPQTFGSNFDASPSKNKRFQLLGHLYALQVNVSCGSKLIVESILYLVGHSFVLGICDIVGCTQLCVKNYIVS